jgi:glycosyltransferase involved in cell wall biosynthesis
MREPDPSRPLLVDPSGRGGIATHTDLACRALVEAGARPELLAPRSLADGEAPYQVLRRLPSSEWGRPVGAAAGFLARRLFEWGSSAAHLLGATVRRRPGLVDFQAALNRRFDARLVRALRHFAPVVWTAHDVLPFERTEADQARFAAIYGAADLVIVHNAAAARDVAEISGAEPVVLDLLAAPAHDPVAPEEARERLNLPASGRILGALGFIRPYKGYDLLAEAWERLGPEAPLLLVMGEVMDESLMPTLGRLEDSGRAVLRLGYASDEDLDLAFSALDALLLPHQRASTSGLAAMAAAIGVPVLASDLPELAAADLAAGADLAVERSPEAWAEAVTGALPARGLASATDLAERGRTRLQAYEQAAGRWLADRNRVAR